MAYVCLVRECEVPAKLWPNLQSISMHLIRAHNVHKDVRKLDVHYTERHLPATIPSTDVEEPKKRRVKNKGLDTLMMQEIWTNGHSKIAMVDSDENIWVAKKVDF